MWKRKEKVSEECGQENGQILAFESTQEWSTILLEEYNNLLHMQIGLLWLGRVGYDRHLNRIVISSV